MENLNHIGTGNLRSATPPKVADFAGGLGIVAAALFIGFLLRDRLGVSDIALMLLIAVQVVAIVYGLWPALAVSVASTLGYNYLFIPPFYTLSVADPANVVTLFLFALAALIMSSLTSLVRWHALIARSARVEVEAEKLRSALLTSVSHDLRTPLASILGSATTLKTCRDSLDESAQRQLIETIREEAERLNRFISDLLDMTKLEAGAVAPRTELVDVSDVVGSALHRAGEVLKHHTLQTTLSADLPMVKLDPVLFEQVLFNLFDNRGEVRARRNGHYAQRGAHRSVHHAQGARRRRRNSARGPRPHLPKILSRSRLRSSACRNRSWSRHQPRFCRGDGRPYLRSEPARSSWHRFRHRAPSS